MAKAKKKGQKGKKKGSAPPHDKGWDKAIHNQNWERPLEALPDPAVHSSLTEIREKILASLDQIAVYWTDCVTVNEFVEELFKVPREKLVQVVLRGARYLKRVIISPPTLAPNLKVLDLSCCECLESVLLQSTTLETVSLHRCTSLMKVVLHTKQLKELNLLECPKISVLVLWSDVLSKLELTSVQPTCVELHCPRLKGVDILPSLLTQEPTGEPQ